MAGGRKQGFLRTYFTAWKRILTLSRRPDEDEFKLLAKLSLLGFGLVGGIAYLIHILYIIFTS